MQKTLIQIIRMTVRILKWIIFSPFIMIYALWIRWETYRWARKPTETQERVMKKLFSTAENTDFGKDHNFKDIHTYEDIKNNIPIRDYEGFREAGYIDPLVAGKPNVLWPGVPLYFAKTSGTTSGAKKIPISKESMPYHVRTAMKALLLYIAVSWNTWCLLGKILFLQGNPTLEENNGIKEGRLSGIVAHYVPWYLQLSRVPNMDLNCIEDWEEKTNAIADYIIDKDMSIIGGIPPWVLNFFWLLHEKSGKKMTKLFRNFGVFVYGGVNYRPYKQRFEKVFGGKVATIETFPASEGFFAIQDKQNDEGLLLQLDSGIFYEFVEADTFFDDLPKRVSIKDVELGINYVLILHTNAGLWAYNIGDTVEFVSLNPHRIIVTGRIKHFISAFGEHVIGKEVEQAIRRAQEEAGGEVTEFTVAPVVSQGDGHKGYHEWFIEFTKEPLDLNLFAEILDEEMRNQNKYYKELVEGNTIDKAVIRKVVTEGFNKYMKSIGKFGGQNKPARLSDNRTMADAIEIV